MRRALVCLALTGCVREAHIHVSAEELARARRVRSVTTSEGVFDGSRMQVVAVENDDGTRKAFRPHVNLPTALKAASPAGTTLVVRQSDYTQTSRAAGTVVLIAMVILGGVGSVLSYGAMATTRDLIKTPFDQAWYRTTFFFGLGVASTGTSAGVAWSASRLRFLRNTELGEGVLGP